MCLYNVRVYIYTLCVLFICTGSICVDVKLYMYIHAQDTPFRPFRSWERQLSRKARGPLIAQGEVMVEP